MKNAVWAWMVAAALLPACSGSSSGDDDTGTDAGGDAGSDTENCTPVAWGSGLTVGTPVADWSFNGYIDQDGDGVVETTAVAFDLEDIHCTLKCALVVIIGDTA
jgi:hypothetical protein